MTTLDARGLSCPEPVIMIQKAMKTKEASYVMMVDNHASKENVTAEAMPVPRDLSSSCGTCVKFETNKNISGFSWSQEVEQVVELTDAGYKLHYHVELKV